MVSAGGFGIGTGAQDGHRSPGGSGVRVPLGHLRVKKWKRQVGGWVGLGLAQQQRTGIRASPHVRATKVTDQLMSETGGLSFRVDNCLDHLPSVSKPRAYCALHNWVDQTKTQQHVMYCPTCNVNLCIKCYRLFHLILNPDSLRKACKRHSV